MGILSSFLTALFGRKELPIRLPYEYYLVEWSDEAIRKGNFDSPYSKEITLYQRGKAVCRYPHTEAMVEALEAEKIPGADATEKPPAYPVFYETYPEQLREVRDAT